MFSYLIFQKTLIDFYPVPLKRSYLRVKDFIIPLVCSFDFLHKCSLVSDRLGSICWKLFQNVHLCKYIQFKIVWHNVQGISISLHMSDAVLLLRKPKTVNCIGYRWTLSFLLWIKSLLHMANYSNLNCIYIQDKHFGSFSTKSIFTFLDPVEPNDLTFDLF